METGAQNKLHVLYNFKWLKESLIVTLSVKETVLNLKKDTASVGSGLR